MKLVRVQNKETKDILFMLADSPSKYIDGDEFVYVKRTEEDKLTNLIKRKSLILHWK